MISMVSNLTQGAKFLDIETEMVKNANEMISMINELENLLEADMESFNQFLSALKLPKETNDQEMARSQKLQEAMVYATEVPLKLARLCQKTLMLSLIIAEKGNKKVISDLGIGAILLESAAHSAFLTMDINLPGIKDEKLRASFEGERDRLAGEVTKSKESILEIVKRRI